MIKKLLNRSILLLVFNFVLFSTAYSQNTYKFECVSVGNDGFVTLKIWNTKKGGNYKFEHACKDAIKAVLYSGVPYNKGCITQKPILQNQEEQAKFHKIEKKFFSRNGAWSTYTLTSQSEIAVSGNFGLKNWKAYQISVSKDLLRKFLEDNNIIKRLNDGF